MTSLVVALCAACVGLASGSLIRAEAIKAVASVETPHSPTCRGCGTPAAAGRLWPLRPSMSWSGRCTSCGAPGAPPLGGVELLAGTTFGAFGLATQDPLPLITYCWVAAVGLTLTLVDLAVHRLPDRFTALLAAGVASAVSLDALAGHTWRPLVEATACGCAAGLLYFVLSLATGGGVGLGDAKLAVGLALAAGWTGWRTAAFAITLGLLLTGLAAAGLLTLKKARHKDPLAHGPFMVLATLTALGSAGL